MIRHGLVVSSVAVRWYRLETRGPTKWVHHLAVAPRRPGVRPAVDDSDHNMDLTRRQSVCETNRQDNSVLFTASWLVVKAPGKVRKSGDRHRLRFYCCFAEKVVGHLSPWCDSNRWQKDRCDVSCSICRRGKHSTHFKAGAVRGCCGTIWKTENRSVYGNPWG